MPRDLVGPFDDAAAAPRDPDAVWARFEELMRRDGAPSQTPEAAPAAPVPVKKPSISPRPAFKDRPMVAARPEAQNAFAGLASAGFEDTAPARTVTAKGPSTTRRLLEIGLAAALAAAATAAVLHVTAPTPVAAVRLPVAVTILGSASPASPAPTTAPAPAATQASLAPAAPFAAPLRVSAAALDIAPPAGHRPAPPVGGVPTPRPATQSATLTGQPVPDGA